MKKLILPIAILCSTLTASAQSILPMPEWTEEAATVEGRIIGYEKGMQWQVVAKRRNLVFDIAAPVASAKVEDDGTFRIEIPVGTTRLKESLTVGEYDFDLILTAGETVGITLNLGDNTAMQQEQAGQLDLPRMSNPSEASTATFSGPMAALNNEMQRDDVCDLANNRYARHICESNERPQTLQDFFRNAKEWRDRNLAAIDSLDALPETKEWLRIEVRGNAMSDMIGATDFVEDEWPGDSLLHTAIDTMLTETMLLFYSSQAMTMTNRLQFTSPQDESLSFRLLGSENGAMQDGMRCTRLAIQLQQEKPFGEDELKALGALGNKAIRNYFLRRNEELKAELASRTGGDTNVCLHDTPADGNIIAGITNEFSGRAILIDLWATWCAPCRLAINQFKPRHGMLTEKGLVTIYLTDTSSPEQEWRSMASGMPGHHYRLTRQQCDEIFRQFRLTGWPSYLIIDRQGRCICNCTGFDEETIVKAIKKAM